MGAYLLHNTYSLDKAVEKRGGSWQQQNPSFIPAPIANALQIGSAKSLTPWLHAPVSLSFDDVTKKYTLKEAEQALQKFFTKNPSTDYHYIHHGTTSNKQTYYIAQYVSQYNTYRVYVLLKKKGKQHEIHSMSFSAENNGN